MTNEAETGYRAVIVGGADPDETAAIMAAVDQLMRETVGASASSQRLGTTSSVAPWLRQSTAGGNGYGPQADWARSKLGGTA